MHTIIEKLCTLWKPGWQGMVMGEMKYKKGNGNSRGRYEEAFSERRFVKVSVTDQDTGERISILLFPFSGNQGESPAPSEVRYWKTFTPEEVHAYSLSLGDHNEIHLTSHPVVSGFQLMEELMRLYPAESVKLRFHHPLYSGEPLYLREEGTGIQGFTDVLCFTMERL